MKVTTIWLNTERQTSVGRSEVDVETCQPVALGFVLSVCPFGVKRVAETMLRQEEKRREYNIKIQQKQKNLPWLGHWLKKL